MFVEIMIRNSRLLESTRGQKMRKPEEILKLPQCLFLANEKKQVNICEQQQQNYPKLICFSENSHRFSKNFGLISYSLLLWL